MTVIGIGRDTGSSHEIIQLVGREITARALKQALRNVATIYTYNGERFDLPFIEVRLGLDLSRNYHHHDLMFDCWDLGLFGGFKRIEQKLGIPRRTAGIDGLMAVQLWFRYINDNDRNALRLLLRYNREDVINLQKLRYRLGV